MKKLLWFLPVALLAGGCSPAPKPINYGTDLCAHCQMTIVDKQFASELVTKKGKVFKFDAIECMTAYFGQNDEKGFALALVQDYNQPGDWQNAEQSFYLISENLPSPMGAYLSAYKDEASAKNMLATKGGEIYDWEELKVRLTAE